MRSLIRWGVATGLAGATVLGTFAALPLKGLALPQKDILEILRPVPMFAITDTNGKPVVLPQKNSQRTVSQVFASKKAAEAALLEVKQALGNVEVRPIPLSDVYNLEIENDNKPEGIDFVFVPVQSQVDIAKRIEKEFKGGTPLFYGQGASGYLTLSDRQTGRQYIPFYFESEQAAQLVRKFQQANPSLANTAQVKVTSLEGAIQTLQQTDNAELKKVWLVPSQESIQFLRAEQQQRQGQSRR